MLPAEETPAKVAVIVETAGGIVGCRTFGISCEVEDRLRVEIR
jgi:hypothetical protein